MQQFWIKNLHMASEECQDQVIAHQSFRVNQVPVETSRSPSPKVHHQNIPKFFNDESPIKLQQDDQELFLNLINCKLCGKFTDTHLLINPCECSGDDEYIHQECLYQEIKQGESQSCIIEIKSDMQSFSCKQCRQIFPLFVKTQIDLPFAIKTRKKCLLSCFTVLLTQLSVFAALLILHTEYEHGFPYKLMFSLFVAFSIIPNLLLLWDQCCITAWKFLDKHRANKKSMQFWISIHWKWYQD